MKRLYYMIGIGMLVVGSFLLVEVNYNENENMQYLNQSFAAEFEDCHSCFPSWEMCDGPGSSGLTVGSYIPLDPSICEDLQ